MGLLSYKEVRGMGALVVEQSRSPAEDWTQEANVWRIGQS